MARRFARARSLTTACFIGLGVSSCSLLLDWNGYTDGGPGPIDAADDATEAADAADADAADVAARMDAREAMADRDATPFDALVAADVEVSETAAPPRCNPSNCGGCCTSDGFCAGGSSSATCGVGGGACDDCSVMGQSCDHGACVSSYDAAAPMCVTAAQCATTICIPIYDTQCCRTDGTCGCQVVIPNMGTCM